MIRPILEGVSKTTDRHSEQTGYRRRSMQRVPEHSNGRQNYPAHQRCNEPIANGGTAAATNLHGHCSHDKDEIKLRVVQAEFLVLQPEKLGFGRVVGNRTSPISLRFPVFTRP